MTDNRSTAAPLITLEGAGLYRAKRWLVRNVSFGLHRGEIVTLIGPNGSGKSTTAKMALGILEPDEGRVQRAKGLRIGYVPQKLSVDWTLPLSVSRLMRLTSRLTQKEIDDALLSVGIPHLGDAQTHHLSGGEFQRVLLARAIARRPDVLVLDEPVQGVDFNGEIALYDLISEIRRQLGCAVLLISHDLHFVMAATDNVICLNGHICCQGSPKAVSQSSAYLDLFGRRAARALAYYEHHHDHSHQLDGQVKEKKGDTQPPGSEASNVG